MNTFRLSPSLIAVFAVLTLVITGCDRSGPSQTVIDWDLHLDVGGVQAIDRWIASRGIETHDLFKGVHRTIPAATWLEATPQLSNDAIPETIVIGPVASVSAPIPFAAKGEVTHFEYQVMFILRDRTTGAELARRELGPGYLAFKTFVDSTAIVEAALLYRGNLLDLVDIDLARGRHQSVVVSIQAEAPVKSGGPSFFGR